MNEIIIVFRHQPWPATAGDFWNRKQILQFARWGALDTSSRYLQRLDEFSPEHFQDVRAQACSSSRALQVWDFRLDPLPGGPATAGGETGGFLEGAQTPLDVTLIGPRSFQVRFTRVCTEIGLCGMTWSLIKKKYIYIFF